MSGDIVERLRLLVPSDSSGAAFDAVNEVTALRAEVERLRAALWDIHAICNNGPFVWARRIRAIARATLRGMQPND